MKIFKFTILIAVVFAQQYAYSQPCDELGIENAEDRTFLKAVRLANESIIRCQLANVRWKWQLRFRFRKLDAPTILQTMPDVFRKAEVERVLREHRWCRRHMPEVYRHMKAYLLESAKIPQFEHMIRETDPD